jgi:hypothetical protein
LFVVVILSSSISVSNLNFRVLETLLCACKEAKKKRAFFPENIIDSNIHTYLLFNILNKKTPHPH